MQTQLFPYDSVRQEQDKMISAVLRTIENGGQLVVHAPTGLGKTAATLAPALQHAIEKGKVVIFMTSRLTQHRLALDTVTKIRQKHGINIPVVDLIGKKHMCLQPGVVNLKGKEFSEYCKAMREDELCEFYTRLKVGDKMSPAARGMLVQLGKMGPNSPEQVRMACAQEEYKLCPYEVTMLTAKDALVIITDYSYLFNPRIREGFLNRIGKSLQDCILVVDEGHNLPDRVKSLASERITTSTIRRTVKELEKFEHDEDLHFVKQIGELLDRMGTNSEEEEYITRTEFLTDVEKICNIQDLILNLNAAAIEVREEQRASSAGALASFLSAWQDEREGFSRILTKIKRESGQSTLGGRAQEERFNILSYRCLDPSVITKEVLEGAHSAIIMSGTLTPVEMYAEVLGTTDPELLTLQSPFPHKNRLNLVIPKTTTQYKKRSPGMYQEIGEVCADVVDAVPGNTAVFFPSYQLLNEVKATLETRTDKTVFTEHSGFTKEEREELLDKFKEYQHTGALLLGVMGGSFSEGIDLPGKELRAVVIVGLPLGRPDLETKALIDYYQEKFGKGWEYGYTYPAFNKTLQSAGRCIRTETDRGIVVFLDERYSWQNYHKCFPDDWEIKLTLLYKDIITEFFAAPAEVVPERGED